VLVNAQLSELASDAVGDLEGLVAMRDMASPPCCFPWARAGEGTERSANDEIPKSG